MAKYEELKHRIDTGEVIVLDRATKHTRQSKMLLLGNPRRRNRC